MISLDSLPPEQLAQIKAQLDQEIQHLSSSFAALSQLRARFLAAKDSLSILDSKDILVPLTSSLYVPGHLSKPDTVTVDVGTGYYVEKSPHDAKVYYNSKVLELGKRLDELQQAVSTKQENRQMLVSVLQVKLANSNQSPSSASPAPSAVTAASS